MAMHMARAAHARAQQLGMVPVAVVYYLKCSHWHSSLPGEGEAINQASKLAYMLAQPEWTGGALCQYYGVKQVTEPPNGT